MPRPVVGFLSDATNTVGLVPSTNYNAAQVLPFVQFSLQGEAEGPAKNSQNLHHKTSSKQVRHNLLLLVTIRFQQPLL